MAREFHTCSETIGPRMPKRRSDNSKRSFSWVQGGYAFKCPKTPAFLANWFAKLKYLWVSWYLSDILTWQWRLEELNSLRSPQFKLLSLYHTFLSTVDHLLPCTLLSAWAFTASQAQRQLIQNLLLMLCKQSMIANNWWTHRNCNCLLLLITVILAWLSAASPQKSLLHHSQLLRLPVVSLMPVHWWSMQSVHKVDKLDPRASGTCMLNNVTSAYTHNNACFCWSR